jgi:hypothetical protein
LCTDSSALDGSNNIATITEQLRIPGTPEVDLLAHRNFTDVPDCNIKAYTIRGDVEKINLNVCAIAGGHQDLAFLLFPLDETTIEIGVGNLAAFMTMDRPSSNFAGNRHHPFSLAGMTAKLYPPSDHSERSCFGHNVILFRLA